jgi:hypothetical protein
MKSLIRFVVIAVLALCSVAAFAGDKKIDLILHQDSTIAGVKVPAGEYKMMAVRQGPLVKFTLLRGGHTIVAADAQFADYANFSGPVAVVTGPNAKVTEIQIAALKGCVVFDQGTAIGGAK